jgi:hypothetical protein
MKSIRTILLLALAFGLSAASRGAEVSSISPKEARPAMEMEAQPRILALPSVSKGMAAILNKSGKIHIAKGLIIVPTIGFRHAGLRMSLAF